ncbi:spermidine synthase [uncultured Pseudoteredinibacter sp.]|uniref:spermine/spermidine synthase domain-containing protein n=1 Tax=uncultured Pseudoteredinibacter sp. TaxID=1641701 RepID=UPI0026018DF7|nr:spermidine synthase [uncultured Pseudoteredinibacter sp.]
MAAANSRLLVFLLIFTLSGFSGLIYQSIWSHYLKLLLGHASYAQVLVLGIFMGGMAIGSMAAAKWGKSFKNLILAYGVAELLIGLFGLGFHSVFINVQHFTFSTLIPAFDSPLMVNSSKWATGALLILPQSILLGATFPLLAAGIIRKFPNNPGNTLAALYFTNSLGAAVGILLNSFYILPAVGLPGSILTAGIINIVLALIVYLISKKDSYEQGPTLADSSVPINSILLLVACLTGFASFLYEIAWIRMLTMVLGGSTHSFELMLSAFIFGLAIGGFWIRKHLDSMKDPIKTLAIVQICMGFFAAVTVPLYGSIFDLMSFGVNALEANDQGYILYLSLSLVLCFIVMLPATICAGMTLPMISYILLNKGVSDSSIGKVYAWNTIGAIAGVLIAAQLIMPVLGLKAVLLIGAAVDLILGLYLLARFGGKLEKQWHYGLVAGPIVLLLFVSTLSFDIKRMSSGVFRYGDVGLSSEKSIIFHEDGKTSTVAVSKNGDFYALINNGKPDASLYIGDEGDTYTGDEPTMVLLGALPYIYRPQAKQIANIGMGSGLTAHTMLLHPEVEQVDTIEIEEEVYHGAKLLSEKVGLVFSDPRSNVIFDDAKTAFSSSQKRYDAIVSEPPNPWVSGVSGLFTTEFYRSMKQYLVPGGVLVQWMHFYELNDQLLASVSKALFENFEYVHVYRVSTGDYAFVAASAPLQADYAALFKYKDFKKQLGDIGVISEQDLSFKRIANRRAIGAIMQSYTIPANSDFFPILDYGASKSRYKRERADSMLMVRRSRLLQGVVAKEKRENFELSPSNTDSDVTVYRNTQLFYAELKQKLESPRQSMYLSLGNAGKSSWMAALLNSCDEELLASHTELGNEIVEITAWLFRFSSAQQMIPFLKGLESCDLSRFPGHIKAWVKLHRYWLEGDFRAVYKLSNEVINGLEFTTLMSKKIFGFNLAAQLKLEEKLPISKPMTPELLEFLLTDVELRALIQIYQSQSVAIKQKESIPVAPLDK